MWRKVRTFIGRGGDGGSVEVDEDNVGWGRFLRLKIILNLFKPLAQGRTIMLGEENFGFQFNTRKSHGSIFSVEEYCMKERVVLLQSMVMRKHINLVLGCELSLMEEEGCIIQWGALALR